jgi:hypothetical protein
MPLALRFGPSPSAEDLHHLRHNMPGAKNDGQVLSLPVLGERSLRINR